MQDNALGKVMRGSERRTVARDIFDSRGRYVLGRNENIIR